MKVLITGATGYVGQHLIGKLKESDHQIYALVRNHHKNDILSTNNVQPIIVDIKYKECFKLLDKDFDIIIHLAFSLFPGADAKTNIDGFDNIVDFAKQNPIKRFIFISSQLVYGNTPKNQLIHEDFQCKTTMTFGKHQLRAENKLIELSKTEKFPMVILRPSEIYGGNGGFFKETQLDGYINGKVPIIGNGNNAISFTYIGDLVQAIHNSISVKSIEGHIFNINTSGVLTLNELITLIKSKINTKPIFKVPSFMGWVVATIAILISKITSRTPFMDYDIVRVATMQSGERSITKATEILNFMPKYPDIREGLIDCYFKN